MLTRGAGNELDMSGEERGSLVPGRWQGNRAGRTYLTAGLALRVFSAAMSASAPPIDRPTLLRPTLLDPR